MTTRPAGKGEGPERVGFSKRRAFPFPAGVIVLAFLVLLAEVADAREWSWLGVRIRDLSEQEMDEIATRHGIREGFGVVIVEVLEDTPAAKAGFKNGDVVVAFEDRPVVETRMLQRLIAAALTGRESRLTVLRAEGRRVLPVRLVSMPRPIVGERIAAEFGFLLRESDAPGEAGSRGLPGTLAAVGVVMRGSPAEKGGLRVGDLLLEVGDRPVLSREAAREALADAATAQPLSLTVRRGEARVSLTLPALEAGSRLAP
ncbi:MAG: PDZ domain-containing protein [Candidatus Rokubacteria bacterium]|nr:PDZ domain-containing protein [Candidatus Rokubacteria bacterium]